MTIPYSLDKVPNMATINAPVARAIDIAMVVVALVSCQHTYKIYLPCH